MFSEVWQQRYTWWPKNGQSVNFVLPSAELAFAGEQKQFTLLKLSGHVTSQVGGWFRDGGASCRSLRALICVVRCGPKFFIVPVIPRANSTILLVCFQLGRCWRHCNRTRCGLVRKIDCIKSGRPQPTTQDESNTSEFVPSNTDLTHIRFAFTNASAATWTLSSEE